MEDPERRTCEQGVSVLTMIVWEFAVGITPPIGRILVRLFNQCRDKLSGGCTQLCVYYVPAPLRDRLTNS